MFLIIFITASLKRVGGLLWREHERDSTSWRSSAGNGCRRKLYVVEEGNEELPAYGLLSLLPYQLLIPSLIHGILLWFFSNPWTPAFIERSFSISITICVLCQFQLNSDWNAKYGCSFITKHLPLPKVTTSCLVGEDTAVSFWLLLCWGSSSLVRVIHIRVNCFVIGLAVSQGNSRQANRHHRSLRYQIE